MVNALTEKYNFSLDKILISAGYKQLSSVQIMIPSC